MHVHTGLVLLRWAHQAVAPRAPVACRTRALGALPPPAGAAVTRAEVAVAAWARRLPLLPPPMPL
jgi:hypothetical protein